VVPPSNNLNNFPSNIPPSQSAFQNARSYNQVMKANFIELNTTEKLDQLIKESDNKPVVLFKHSTSCPISAGVYQEVSNATADINLVVIQKARNVSSAIAEKTGVRHESPQAIVLKNGKVIYQASHYDVTARDIEKILKSDD
jgi:bacillithiol system protein YtxJ